VREESHLADMRAAIRGDFERLAERRGHQELMRESESHPEEERDRLALVPAVTPDGAEEDAAQPDPGAVEHKRSWLDRLRGR
jgi:hypothetical protein